MFVATPVGLYPALHEQNVDPGKDEVDEEHAEQAAEALRDVYVFAGQA